MRSPTTSISIVRTLPPSNGCAATAWAPAGDSRPPSPSTTAVVPSGAVDEELTAVPNHVLKSPPGGSSAQREPIDGRLAEVFLDFHLNRGHVARPRRLEFGAQPFGEHLRQHLDGGVGNREQRA